MIEDNDWEKLSPLLYDIEEFENICFEPGETSDIGCSVDSCKAICEKLVEKTGKNVTAVSEWCWCNLEYSEIWRDGTGLFPSIIIAYRF